MNIRTVPASVRPVFRSVQKSSSQMLPYWSAAALTALFSVVFTKAFGWSEDLAFRWTANHPAWGFALTPAAMLASAAMAQFLVPSAAGSGIPQLLAAIEAARTSSPLVEKLLSLKMIVVKFFGACVCVAGGGVTGREGPMLQIAAAIFHNVQKLWPRLTRSKAVPNVQSMILAGGAAGLASAFNTPLGGVIFAIEELAKVHISHIRTYVFHAVIIAGILAQALVGNYLYFGRVHVVSIQPHEIFPLITAAAFIGVAGAVFGRLVVEVLDFRAKFGAGGKLIMTFACGAIVAAIAFWGGREAIGSGRGVIVDLLTHPDATAPFYLGLVRGTTNFLTYAGGVVGGVFAPALSTGAALGSSLSALFPEFNHQLWVLAGMAAFLTGVTRTPFTSLILVSEMTDTHDIIIYLMLAAIIAQGAAKLVDHESFYERACRRLLSQAP